MRPIGPTPIGPTRALACRRPGELSPNIQPMIATPAHSSLPSGHATEAFAVATVLNAIVRLGRASGRNGPENASKAAWERYAHMFSMVAARVGVNRTVAGVHFPVDTVAGCTLGVTLGQYMLWRCGAQQLNDNGRFVEEAQNQPQVIDYQAWMFEAWGYDGDEDFSRALQIEDNAAELLLKEASSNPGDIDISAGKRMDVPFQQQLDPGVQPPRRDDRVLERMLRRAVGEWD